MSTPIPPFGSAEPDTLAPPTPHVAAPAVGSFVLHRPTFTFGKIARYHEPNSYLREGAAPDEKPVTTWAVELDTGDVLVWMADAFEPLVQPELVILAGATSGVNALFRGIATRAKQTGVPFARACELLGAALGMQLRMLEAASAQAVGGAVTASHEHDAGKDEVPA